MKRVLVLLSLGLFLTPAPAALAAATPEEAQRLTKALQAYFSNEPGVVSVAPAGESYTAHFDFTKLLDKLQGAGLSASLKPLDFTLTDEGSGKWKISCNQPISLSLKAQGLYEVQVSIGSVSGTSWYDEVLGNFTSGSSELSDLAVTQTIWEAQTTTRTAYMFGTLSSQVSVQKVGDYFDVTKRQTFTDFKEEVTVNLAGGASPRTAVINLTSPRGSVDEIEKGLRMSAIHDLIKWASAHTSSQAIIADQAAFKDKLRAILPVFDSGSLSLTLQEPNVSTQVGTFTADESTVLWDSNGFGANGRLRETIGVTGLDVPAALLPPWAAGLVPDTFKVDVTVSDFDLAAPAALILDKLDLSQPQPLPQQIEGQLVQALLPKGSVNITLGPSQFLSKLYDLTAEGSMMAGPASAPSGEALLKLKGLDETVAALQAGPPDVHQMADALLTAKNLGKAEPDGAVSWKIEAKPEGAITVNGVDLTTRLNGGQ